MNPTYSPNRSAMRSLVRIAALTIALVSAFATFAQQAPLLNVPYKCPDGRSFTFLSCTPVKTDQWCTSRWEQNGQLITTANSYYSSMTGRMAGCTPATPNQTASTSGTTSKTAATTPPAAAAPSQTAAPQFPAPGTALNPAYLKDFPSPDQIMAKVKGSSASDTTVRQIATLREFKQMIQDLAGSRWLHGQLTPDESRVWGAYDVAYNNLARPLNFPDDSDYFGRRDFINSLFSAFQMPNVQQQWNAVNTANVAKDQKQPNPASPANPPSNAPVGTNPYSPIPSGARPLPATNDPGQLAMRRCVELGGQMLKCIGSGMSADLPFIGLDIPAGNPHGLVIFGYYQGSNQTSFIFKDSTVVISGCGKLAAGDHAYTVQAFGTGFALKITNQPQTVIAAIGADGKLVGPASQVITGLQITGYTYQAKRDPVTGGPVPGTEHNQVPTYGPIVQNCAIGTLPQGPPQDPTPVSTNPDGAILSALFSLVSTGSAVSSQTPTLAPGPRMIGVYTNGSDFRIQFQDANAVIDCKQAHIISSYTVSDKGGVATVSVANGTTPFALAVSASATLTGPASVTVNGKLFTALNGSDPVLTPTSATCSAASLSAPAK